MGRRRGKGVRAGRSIVPESGCCIWLLLLVPLLWWYHRVQKVATHKDEL